MAKVAATGKGRKPAPKDESKAVKFSRLATQRVQKAVKALQTIGGLSSSSYERTDEQVAKIDSIVTETWASVMEKFNAPGGKTQNANFVI